MGLVLIVDDDVDIINLVKKYLGDEGHQVMSAATPSTPKKSLISSE